MNVSAGTMSHMTKKRFYQKLFSKRKMIWKVLDAKGKWKNIETKRYKKNIRKKKLKVNTKKIVHFNF